MSVLWDGNSYLPGKSILLIFPGHVVRDYCSFAASHTPWSQWSMAWTTKRGVPNRGNSSIWIFRGKMEPQIGRLKLLVFCSYSRYSWSNSKCLARTKCHHCTDAKYRVPHNRGNLDDTLVMNNVMYHCITSHIISNTSDELHNFGRGNDVATYNEKGCMKQVWKPLPSR